MKPKICSFCLSPSTDENPSLAGQKDDVYICKNCINAAHQIINKISKEPDKHFDNFDPKDFTPKFLKSILDEYVIGQDRAKKIFSIGVYNHYKRNFKQSADSDTKIEKSNILLIGPTGSGKTLMAQTMAKKLNIPFAISDATSLTEAGYVGEDVENILTKLLQAADGNLERAQNGIIFIDEIDKISRLSENRSITRDVSGEGVQQALLKIIEGSVVNISPKGGRKHPNQDFVQMDTTNILFIAGGAFDGLDEIISRRIGKNVLGFNQEKTTKEKKEALLAQVSVEDLVSYGMIPELLGRLHIITKLQDLTKEDLVRILKEPKNSLLSQYKSLFELDGASLVFEEDALEEVAKLSIKNKTGARGLRAIMEDCVLDTMYELPELDGYEVVITKDCVNKKEKPLCVKQKKSKKTA